METESFKSEIQVAVQFLKSLDNGTIGGSAFSAWALVNVLPPTCVWLIFVEPGIRIKSDVVAFLGGVIALVPTLATFLVCLPPALLASGVGAIFGLVRQKKQIKLGKVVLKCTI